MNKNHVLGIDVGASGIKGAVVDIATGAFAGLRHRIPMPDSKDATDVAESIEEIRQHFRWTGAIGIGFPSVVKNGVVHTASNIANSWIGVDAGKLFGEHTNQPVFVLNDADAAGIAEMSFGYGRDHQGTVLMLTIGTGIGSALFHKGILVPNTEFGHVYMFHGRVAEHYCADSAKKRERLSWQEWATRFNTYLQMMDFYLRPDLFLLSGGTSKNFDSYSNFFDPDILVKTKPGLLLNNAGIVGAAMYAHQQLSD
jgi:polyphosphate glucokinase